MVQKKNVKSSKLINVKQNQIKYLMEYDIDGKYIFSELRVWREILSKKVWTAIEALHYLKAMDGSFLNA